MDFQMSRRRFLGQSAAVAALAASNTSFGQEQELPRVDLHVHLDNSTIDAVLGLSEERKIKFGIVEHAGTKENKYPVVLSNDKELNDHIDRLKDKPVFVGVQAEWTDWASCFSKETLARLDYILTDAWTFPGPDGKRMKLWEKEAVIDPPEKFIDRYVDWHVKIISTEPIDILANVSWLPGDMMAEYDRWWTDARIAKVLDAALKFQVAIEINSGFQLPKPRFLQAAKEAGLKFSFGTNGRYPKMGLLDYSFEMAKGLKLTAADIFVPGKDAQKAVQRRM
jgi:histidinol phosphatase-like PHP family hydrolase